MPVPLPAHRALDRPLPPAPERVLRAARLFTGATTGHILDGAVVVRDGLIAWSGPAADLPQPQRDWAVTDYGDATILPGLVETHAHLGSYARAVQPDVPDPARHAVGFEALASVKIARQLATVGVTTVQSLGGAHYLDVALREAVAAGLIEGPRIVAAGPPITPTGGHDWQDGGEADSLAGLRRQVRDHHKAGADAIKIMATGGFMSHSTAPWNAQFTVEEFRVVVDEAHRLGLHVAAHAHGTQGIERVVEAGVDFIAHGSFVGPDGRTAFDPALADRIAARGIYVDTCAPPSYPPVAGETNPHVLALWRHGVKVVPGHDIGAVAPASGYTQGLKRWAAAGLPTAEILVAATSRAAAAVGLAGVTGALLPGYSAEILVVAGDPLADLAALDRVIEVVIFGRAFQRDQSVPADPTDRLNPADPTAAQGAAPRPVTVETQLHPHAPAASRDRVVFTADRPDPADRAAPFDTAARRDPDNPLPGAPLQAQAAHLDRLARAAAHPVVRQAPADRPTIRPIDSSQPQPRPDRLAQAADHLAERQAPANPTNRPTTRPPDQFEQRPRPERSPT
jgi:imidazolonepropionase-like amidohydrolase